MPTATERQTQAAIVHTDRTTQTHTHHADTHMHTRIERQHIQLTHSRRTHTHAHTHAHAHVHRATARAARPTAVAHLFLHVKLCAGIDQLGCCLRVTHHACRHQRCAPMLQRQQTGRRASDAMPLAAGARVSRL